MYEGIIRKKIWQYDIKKDFATCYLHECRDFRNERNFGRYVSSILCRIRGVKDLATRPHHLSKAARPTMPNPQYADDGTRLVP